MTATESEQGKPLPGPKAAKDSGSDVVSLVIAYVKQETLGNLKRSGRFAGISVIGSVLLIIGFLLAGLGVVRLLQVELHKHLSGSLVWVPYCGGLLFAVAVIGVCAMLIMREPK